VVSMLYIALNLTDRYLVILVLYVVSDSLRTENILPQDAIIRLRYTIQRVV
jgi:hypothetical protein